MRLLSYCQKKLDEEGKPAGGSWLLRTGWEEIAAREIPSAPGASYLLDVSQSDDIPKAEFGEDLIRDSDFNRYDGVFLVVITTPEVWQECHGVTAIVTRDVPVPDPYAVTMERLQTITDDNRYESWLADLSFQALVTRLKQPSEAVALAKSISSALQREDAEEAKQSVLDEFQSWRSYLTTWFKKHDSVPERAALVAAAVLDPAPPARMLDARNELLREIGEPEESVGPLSGPGRSGYLVLLEAGSVDKGFSISATRHGLDEAVIIFVWNEFPQMHRVLQNWLIGLAEGAPSHVVERVAHITVKTAIRARSNIFLELVKKIVLERQSSYALAIKIIDGIVLDSGVGAFVRHRLLQWARGANEFLASFAVDACSHTLLQERPRIALKRIFEGLNRESPDSGFRNAQKVLLEVSKDGSAALIVCDVVAEWLSQDGGNAGVKAFLVINYNVPAVLLANLADASNASTEEFFRKGWSAAIGSDVDRSELIGAMRSLIDVCNKCMIPPSVVMRIVGPVLAESINSDVAMAALRAKDDGVADPIRDHLMRELIYGDLASAFGIGVEEVVADA
ncbi:hypothetical protein [Micromonospora eburnea]|uniref:hypothetical protein n=1 Tax=Micromonospora eburnea TaxID=227316 RepID=UPI00114CC7E8|nr:hypothetical protein [Micromonospora eburnea]